MLPDLAGAARGADEHLRVMRNASRHHPPRDRDQSTHANTWYTGKIKRPPGRSQVVCER
jgi:hypothetical protein